MNATAPRPATGSPAVHMVRTFHAPRALVWKAWTDADELRQWWGPHGFTNADVSVDLRSGGRQRIDMVGPDGQHYPMESELVEVVPERKLVLRNGIIPDPSGRPQAEVLTTVGFAEERGRTILTVDEEVIRSSPAAAPALAGMEIGMEQSLERLGGHVGSLVLAVAEDEPILWMARIFDAPRELVWKALTEPEHLRHWWGQRNATNIVCEMDARPGGSWRIHQRYDAPQSETGVAPGTIFKFKGSVLEVVPPEKIVQTFEMEEMFEGKVIVETLTLTAVRPDRTLYKVVSRFQGPTAYEDRAGMIASGMSYGAQETYDRLAEYLASM